MPIYTYRPTEKQLRAATRLAARLRLIASRIADGEIPDITSPRSSFVNTMNEHARRLEILIRARSPKLMTSISLKRARVICPQYEQCLLRGTIHGARLHQLEQQSQKINPTRFSGASAKHLQAAIKHVNSQSLGTPAQILSSLTLEQKAKLCKEALQQIS